MTERPSAGDHGGGDDDDDDDDDEEEEDPPSWGKAAAWGLSIPSRLR